MGNKTLAYLACTLRNVNSNDNGNVNGNNIDDGDRDLFAEALVERTITDTVRLRILVSPLTLVLDKNGLLKSIHSNVGVVPIVRSGQITTCRIYIHPHNYVPANIT